MSNYRILHATEYGYVVCCKNCHHFHVGFSGRVFVFTKQQFLSFTACVGLHHADLTPQATKEPKSIQIATKRGSVTLTCVPAEVKQLNVLLCQSGMALAMEPFFRVNYN